MQRERHRFGSKEEEEEEQEEQEDGDLPIVPLRPCMYSRPVHRSILLSQGGVLSYEQGTPVAGASCFVLGVSCERGAPVCPWGSTFPKKGKVPSCFDRSLTLHAKSSTRRESERERARERERKKERERERARARMHDRSEPHPPSAGVPHSSESASF